MITTHLSSKGQIVLPKYLREAHHWEPGLTFIIEEQGENILLRPIKYFAPTSLNDVVGSAQYKGPKKTLQDYEDAIAKGIKENQ